SRTIRSSPRASQRSSSSETQMRPRPWVAMKLITSGVALRAAVTKSPSFSRSSSSTTITTLPWRMSSMASSMRSNISLISLEKCAKVRRRGGRLPDHQPLLRTMAGGAQLHHVHARGQARHAELRATARHGQVHGAYLAAVGGDHAHVHGPRGAARPGEGHLVVRGV